MHSPVRYVDAFTDIPGSGNRAGVVLEASHLSPAQMQAVAREARAVETAFGVQSPEPAEYDLEVRYFSQTSELPYCGHATLAFHYLRAVELALPEGVVRAKTGAGVLPVRICRGAHGLQVVMTQAQPRILATPPAADVRRVLAALGLNASDLVADLPVQVVTTGHAKLILPLRSPDALARLKPDMALLMGLSPFHGASGFFVFCCTGEAGVLYHGRMFAPATGVPEDAVTGNAHGATGYYLFQHGRLPVLPGASATYVAVQGQSLGRPGRVEVTVQVEHAAVAVHVSGRAVIVK